MNSELLFKFFRGVTSAREATVVKTWVEKDPANRERFAQERKVFDALLLSKSKKDIQAELTRRKAWRKPLMRNLMRAAAVFAVAFISGWLVTSALQGEGSKLTQTISVPAGHRINITLPDGSNVWLNGRTTIEYPVEFNKHDRAVKLDGQAYFDIAHDKSKPFVVNTAKGSVKVLGTKFDVKAHSESGEFETMLTDGKVKVWLADDPEHGVTLSPDMVASLENGRLVRRYVRDYDPYRWRDGLICFTNASFRKILDELQENYNILIEVHKQNLPSVSYTGKFRISDGIDYALKVLQKDANFAFERSEDHNIIYIK